MRISIDVVSSISHLVSPEVCGVGRVVLGEAAGRCGRSSGVLDYGRAGLHCLVGRVQSCLGVGP